MITKAEYIAATPNIPVAGCDKHYYIDGQPVGKLYVLTMEEQGYKCPKCKDLYPYKIDKE